MHRLSRPKGFRDCKAEVQFLWRRTKFGNFIPEKRERKYFIRNKIIKMLPLTTEWIIVVSKLMRVIFLTLRCKKNPANNNTIFYRHLIGVNCFKCMWAGLCLHVTDFYSLFSVKVRGNMSHCGLDGTKLITLELYSIKGVIQH